jgi:Fe-S cluster biogenesis protein NfuA
MAKIQNKKVATTENITEILTRIRPYIKMHNGDVDLDSFQNEIVTLVISGACSHCRLADLTYNTLIAGLFQDELSGIKKIIIKK